MTRIAVAALFVTSLIVPSIADACRCGPPAACLSLSNASDAFVGLVTEDVPVSRQDPASRVGLRRYRFTIERTLRGGLSGSIELVSGGNGDCSGYTFVKGQRYLVYASKKEGILTTGYCSGNLPIAAAAEHLVYLNRPPTPPLAGRVSGMVFLADSSGGKPMPHIRVVARGNGFSRETTADARGWFQFLQLPVAPFSVTAFPPPPFIVASGYEQRDTPDPRQCTAVSIIVKYDGRLAGKIEDAAGRPLPGVPVHARPSEIGTSIADAKTDSAGAYELQGLPPGRYIVGVNINRPPSVEAPYQALFSPGTSIESKAVPIALAAGQHTQVPTLTMPAALRAAALRGCVAMPDRQPATEAIVGIEWARDGISGSRGESVALDARGCFSVVAHEGNRYGLSASLYLPGGVFLLAQHTGTIAGASGQLSLTLEPPRRRR